VTTEEFEQFLGWLDMSAAPASVVLDVGSGSGGPALFLACTLGCTVTGLDKNPDGVRVANQEAQRLGLDEEVHFLVGDASQPLPFEDHSFTAVICIDGMNHLPGRLQVLNEWHRVLRPGGRILYTDPVVLTGLLSTEEFALRSAAGSSFFAPPGEDERLIQQAGFQVRVVADATKNIAAVAHRWYMARAKHREALIEVEGEEAFEQMQQGLSVVHLLSKERRLSRFVFVAQK